MQYCHHLGVIRTVIWLVAGIRRGVLCQRGMSSQRRCLMPEAFFRARGGVSCQMDVIYISQRGCYVPEMMCCAKGVTARLIFGGFLAFCCLAGIDWTKTWCLCLDRQRIVTAPWLDNGVEGQLWCIHLNRGCIEFISTMFFIFLWYRVNVVWGNDVKKILVHDIFHPTDSFKICCFAL